MRIIIIIVILDTQSFVYDARTKFKVVQPAVFCVDELSFRSNGIFRATLVYTCEQSTKKSHPKRAHLFIRLDSFLKTLLTNFNRITHFLSLCD